MSSLINSLLFKPPTGTTPPPTMRLMMLDTSKGTRISVCMIRKRSASVTVLFSHGNAEDLNLSYAWMKRLSRDVNVNVIGYDYTGYGRSTGKPTEQNCYADIEAVYKFLLEDQKINPEQIVLYGRSLGSGPSCYLAQKTSLEGRPVAGMILHSPFASVYRVVIDVGFTMVGDKFSNIDRIEKVQCPVFIIHGRVDEVVPFEHGKALYDALPRRYRAAPFWVDGMGHNDLEGHAEIALLASVNRYLDYHILSRRLW
eukprot:CAMPEP_0118707188 /NCGR_PEP_ID=MMETSP0800-20121206/21035_1 /TAXON_ID=210618 ORGANISM="Striatella unipunctata, Strain CCMP2910" /NCGR_SAMPLE_ID=MMETSP0800 /ASSEMBLY_ACC=CAM_ASM_000638 /LENGTH=254 /DNA_ID=CAMNT_0006609927 /DNA_START=161 /DNA_END=922 /DNA_ORIENTATION=+